MLFPSYTAKLQEELWVFLHHSQSPSELSWSYRCPALHRVFLATAAFRALERKLLSSELGSSVITCLKSQIHKRTAHSLLVSEKKKKRPHFSMASWPERIAGCWALVEKCSIEKCKWERNLSENLDPTGDYQHLKIWPSLLLKYLALKWAKSEVTFQKPPAFIPPYSQVALKILVVLMSSIVLKPGKKKTHFSWLNAQVSSRYCFNNRLIRKFPDYLYCLPMLKDRMLFLNFNIIIE